MALKTSAIARAMAAGLVSLGLVSCTEGEGGASIEPDAGVAIAAATGNCTAEEPAIFSCTLESGNQVSICVTQGLGEDEGISFAQFRMGPAGGAPVTVWPEKPGDGTMRWHSEAYSGGGSAMIGFTTEGGRQYAAYSSVIRTNFEPGEPNDPEIADGFISVGGGQLPANDACIGEGVAAVDVALAELHASRVGDRWLPIRLGAPGGE